MKTAREQLYDEVTSLLVKPADNAAGEMKKIMSRYRVQTKPGIEIGDGPTARDALGARLIDIWRTGGNDDATRAKMETLIDQFRMQMKTAGPEKPAASTAAPVPTKKPLTSPAAPAPAKQPAAKASPAPPPSPAMSPAQPAAPAANPAARAPAQSVSIGLADPPRQQARAAEPVAGGPRTRKKARGECPKCKSMGVVLARSYAGDEYYSCIYCGWQAYKPTDDDDPNASLALRLLGQTLGSD